MMWTPYDWLNKGYNFYITAVAIISGGRILELKCIVETNLIKVS